MQIRCICCGCSPPNNTPTPNPRISHRTLKQTAMWPDCHMAVLLVGGAVALGLVGTQTWLIYSAAIKARRTGASPLRRDPWDRQQAIMRASPRLTGSQNRGAFVRAVWKKKKCWARQILVPPPHTSTPVCFSFSLKTHTRARAHTRMLIYLSVFARGPGGRASASAGGSLKEHRGCFVVKTGHVSAELWDACSGFATAK